MTRCAMSFLLLALALVGCESSPPCTGDLCASTRDRTVRLDAPGARACELAIRDRGERVVDVEVVGASGAHVREAPRTAIAIHGEREIASDAVRVRVAGEGEPPMVDVARCWDRDGAALARASARIES